MLPKLVAVRMPCQLAGAAGGFQRRLPTGGAAKGIPRKARKAPSMAPWTWPDFVQTTVDVLTQPIGGGVVALPPQPVREASIRTTSPGYWIFMVQTQPLWGTEDRKST